MNDLGFAVRQRMKKPGFTAVADLTPPLCIRLDSTFDGHFPISWKNLHPHERLGVELIPRVTGEAISRLGVVHRSRLRRSARLSPASLCEA